MANHSISEQIKTCQSEEKLSELLVGRYGDVYTTVIAPCVTAAPLFPSSLTRDKESFLRDGPFTENETDGIPHCNGAYVQASFLDVVLRNFFRDSEDKGAYRSSTQQWFAKSRFKNGKDVPNMVALGFRHALPVWMHTQHRLEEHTRKSAENKLDLVNSTFKSLHSLTF